MTCRDDDLYIHHFLNQQWFQANQNNIWKNPSFKLLFWFWEMLAKTIFALWFIPMKSSILNFFYQVARKCRFCGAKKQIGSLLGWYWNKLCRDTGYSSPPNRPDYFSVDQTGIAPCSGLSTNYIRWLVLSMAVQVLYDGQWLSSFSSQARRWRNRRCICSWSYRTPSVRVINLSGEARTVREGGGVNDVIWSKKVYT